MELFVVIVDAAGTVCGHKDMRKPSYDDGGSLDI